MWPRKAFKTTTVTSQRTAICLQILHFWGFLSCYRATICKVSYRFQEDKWIISSFSTLYDLCIFVSFQRSALNVWNASRFTNHGVKMVIWHLQLASEMTRTVSHLKLTVSLIICCCCDIAFFCSCAFILQENISAIYFISLVDL